MVGVVSNYWGPAFENGDVVISTLEYDRKRGVQVGVIDRLAYVDPDTAERAHLYRVHFRSDGVHERSDRHLLRWTPENIERWLAE